MLAEGRLLGATEDAQQTIWKHRRAAGFVLGHGVFERFFDLHGGYYDDPAILDEVGRLNRLMDAAKHDDRSSVAEVLVVSDEIACDYASFNSQLLDELLLQTQVPLTKIGTPFDAILLEHLHRVDMSPYKLVIFLNAFLLTEVQLELIHNRVMCDGRTVFWAAAPGLFADKGRLRANLQEVTGIQLSVLPALPAVASRFVSKTGPHPLSRARTVRRQAVRA